MQYWAARRLHAGGPSAAVSAVSAGLAPSVLLYKLLRALARLAVLLLPLPVPRRVALMLGR